VATNRTVRYIKFASSNSSIHNGSGGVNSDGDVGSYQQPTFRPYDRRSLGTGQAWNVGSQKVTLSHSNTTSQTLSIRFTNDDDGKAIGAPDYGGGTPVSMLIPYRGIPTSRCAAYVQTIAYYVRTFTENASGASCTFNINIKAGPGNWDGGPPSINPQEFNFTQINSSGNGFRGEKIIPKGRGTLYHSGSDFDFDGHINPSLVSNVEDFNFFSPPGFGFSDWIPTFDNSTAMVGDGTSTVDIKITTDWGGGEGSITFYANPQQIFDINQSTTSTVLHYQGLDIEMDGSDSDHTIPTMTTTSTMAVVANQEFFLDNLTLATTSSVSEDSVNTKICPQTDLATTSSLSVTPSFKLGFTKTLDATSLFLVSTANLTLLDNETLTASTSLSATPSFKIGTLETLTASTSTATAAGIKFDITGDYIWDSFNLNTYFEVGYAADNFALEEGEYTWDFLATTAWDDWPVSTWLGNEQTWDNWPDDVWETPYVLNTNSSITLSPTFKLGDVVTYTGAFTLAEDVALNQPAQASVSATTTFEATAQGLLEASAALTGAFTPTLSVGLKFALDDTPIAITGAFNTILTASAITDTFADIDVSSSISITPTFKPAGFGDFSVTTTTALIPLFKPGGLAALTAFASTLQVGRLFFQADPFNTIKVDAETRTIVLPVENRQTLVMAENRVNIVSAETRAHLVPQETRSLKLNIPPMTNAFSTPRVRSNH
tara:strand:- start:1714 stop:3861 length:2148 start_codon:yes stop_codon:yes gene_type:complete